MDFTNRAGNKVGGGGVASFSQANLDRRERLRRLAMETLDLSKDPYFMKNNLGSYECRLCLTIHTNEGSYLSHTQGKRHQANLGKRKLKEQMLTNKIVNGKNEQFIQENIKLFKKVGIPGYRIAKLVDPNTLQKSILFEIEYSLIKKEVIPRYRVMSSFEQKIELPNDLYQYIIFAAEPYENIAFKIPNLEIDNAQDKYYNNWDEETKIYSLRIYFKENKKENNNTNKNDKININNNLNQNINNIANKKNNNNKD